MNAVMRACCPLDGTVNALRGLETGAGRTLQLRGTACDSREAGTFSACPCTPSSKPPTVLPPSSSC